MYIMIYIYIHTDTLFVTTISHRRVISSVPTETRVARVLTYLKTYGTRCLFSCWIIWITLNY